MGTTMELDGSRQVPERGTAAQSRPTTAPCRRAVFLDRDGVLNASVVRDGRPYPPGSVAEVTILPRVLEALVDLKQAGFMTIVVTNQPDVARGTQSREVVEEIDAYLASRLPLDEFKVCYHDDRQACGCRKPAPGLILSAAEEHGIDVGFSYMVGRPVAGRRSGTTRRLPDDLDRSRLRGARSGYSAGRGLPILVGCKPVDLGTRSPAHAFAMMPDRRRLEPVHDCWTTWVPLLSKRKRTSCKPASRITRRMRILSST